MEYRVENTDIRNLQKTLNEWSSQGWTVKEVISSPLAGAKVTVVFERAKVLQDA
jgi:hypothetical protein